ncbi:MAG: RNA polymerase sigma factor [Polyangiales bacterium]
MSVDPLIARLVRGDPFALSEVYERHHARIRAFARRMVGNASAEDLVQDVFMALPKAMRRFRGDCSIETFLLSIAANRSRHHARSLFRFRRAIGRVAEEPVSRRSRDAEEVILQGELRAALERGIAKLSHNHRVTFVLCSVEERSSVEAASILGVPEGTVRTRLFHARQKLRDHLKRQGYG